MNTNPTPVQIDPQVLAAISAGLRTRLAPAQYDPEANPYAGADLTDLTSGLGLRIDEKRPASNIAQRHDATAMAVDMEEAAFTGFRQGSIDRSKARAAAAANRRARAAQFAAVAATPLRPEPEALTTAWQVVVVMEPLLRRMARAKQPYAERLVGVGLADDVTGMVFESMALALSKAITTEQQDPGVLVQAALQLAGWVERNNRLPGDQEPDKEAKAEAKAHARARKWLMGMANNRVMDTITDLFRAEQNLRWDSLDIIDTVMATINGPGDDPMHASSKVNLPPTMLGTRFPRPGGTDSALIATSINAALTEHGLDPLVEILLSSLRTDGKVPWTSLAEQIFLATPGGHGQWLWSQVVLATQPLGDAARAERGVKARLHVRNLFGWLPDFLVALIQAHEIQVVGWHTTEFGTLPRMVSGFDAHYDDGDTGMGAPRHPLVPALSFDTIDAATRALSEHLGSIGYQP